MKKLLCGIAFFLSGCAGLNDRIAQLEGQVQSLPHLMDAPEVKKKK